MDQKVRQEQVTAGCVPREHSLRAAGSAMRPTAETSRTRRRRHTAPPKEASKEDHETEIASIEAGLKLLDVYSSAMKDLKERGQDAAGNVQLALDVKHAPRDWSNPEILSVMSDVIDEHPRPELEFVLGVLGVSKMPNSLDERLRSQGAKAYAIGVRTRALRRKKEAREREERERREKKEREEREKREKKEREEREKREKKEKEEKKRKEKLEKERAEAEKKKLAERKEVESKRGRGRGRRGRRGRPPTRIIATERAKKIDADREASAAEVLLEVSRGPVQNANAMKVDTDGPKQDVNIKKMPKTDPSTDAKQMDITSDRPTVSTGQVSSEKGAPTSTTITVSPPPREVKTLAKSASGTESGDQLAGEMSKERQSLPTDTGRLGPKTVTSAKRKVDPMDVLTVSKEAQPSESGQKAEDKADRLQNKRSVTNEIRELAEARNAKQQPAEVAMATNGKPEVVHQGAQEVPGPEPPREAAVKEAQFSEDQPVVATPEVIAEAKIASALKESAAAVNGEISEAHLNRPVSKKTAADVGEGSGGVQEEAPGEKVAVVEDATDEKPTIESERKLTGPAKDDGVTPEDAATLPTTIKEPIQLKATVPVQRETSPDAKTVDEKDVITDSSVQPADKPKKQETTPKAALHDSKGEEAAEVVKEGEKEATKPSEESKEVPEMARDADDESRAAEAREADGEEKAKGGLAKEDFMADVFGSEDEDGEKDESEEGGVKRGRYRFRGRQSEHEARAKGKAKTESEEDRPKEKRKRGRPKGARRMTRRVSSIPDDIVMATAGRRMRRESRNLINGVWRLPAPNEFLRKCVDVWERLHGNRISIPFRQPVAAKDAPGYFEVVKEPMDMRTVKEMMNDGRVATPEDFYRKMMLIVSNAVLFNDEESDLYELALELRGMIRKDTKPIVKWWRESRGMVAEESESESEVENQKKRGKVKKRKVGRPKGKKNKAAEKRKRGGEDEAGRSTKKRRTSRRSARREDDEQA